MMSPDHDITPLLGLKLPQLRLVCLPIYKVIDVGIWVIGHVYFLRGGTAVFAKEKEGALLPTFATIFIGGALQLLVSGVVPKTFATPLGVTSR